MSIKLTLLALSLASLTTGLPIHRTSQNTTSQFLNVTKTEFSTHALAKRTTTNPPFDPYEYNHNGHRTDGDLQGDIFRLSKCYCVDTPTRDLPAVYGQYYGSYYGFDYYNYHQDKSYAFNWTCASGELETLNPRKLSSTDYYFLAPKCLSWMEEDKKQCWDTGDGNEFCVEVKHGNDYYYWNGQKRMVHNHPAKTGTTSIPAPLLNEECQQMCQTVPGIMGPMQDVIPSDHEHKINLATATTCSKYTGVGMDTFCEGDAVEKPREWETWNYIETYSDQADMCKGCA